MYDNPSIQPSFFIDSMCTDKTMGRLNTTLSLKHLRKLCLLQLRLRMFSLSPYQAQIRTYLSGYRTPSYAKGTLVHLSLFQRCIRPLLLRYSPYPSCRPIGMALCAGIHL